MPNNVGEEWRPQTVLIDGFSVFFRSFHAFPLSLSTPDGRPSNAVFGFCRLLFEIAKNWNPQYLVVAADTGEATFRHLEYASYKAQRPEAPHELTAQIPIWDEVMNALGLPLVRAPGFEADDVLATLAVDALKEERGPVLIVSSDRDLFQLVNGGVRVLVGKGKDGLQLLDKLGVIERLGVPPHQVPDWKALAGDPSDNIPGVAGIGPKTAARLLAQAPTVEAIYEQIDSIEASPSVKEKLVAGYENAMQAKKLTRLDTEVPLGWDWNAAKLDRQKWQLARQLFTDLGFKSLLKSLPTDNFVAGAQTALF